MTAKGFASDDRSPERSDRLAQANHILTHLQSQLAELDRREQHLNQQLSALLEQQRTAQRDTQRSQARALELNQRESDLSKGQAKLEQHETELQAREEQLSTEREQFSAEKSAFETTLADHEQARLKSSQELAERELRVGQRELEARRERTELDQLRTELQRSQQECAVRQTRLDDERALLQTQKQEFEEYHDQATTALNDRERATTDLEQEVDQRLATVTTQEKQVVLQEQTLAEQLANVEQTRLTLKEDVGREVLQERQELEQARERLDADRIAQNQRVEEWNAHVKTERETHLAQLTALRKEKLAGLDQREKELERREIDMEKRRQFHETHLDKIRNDLNTRKVELERDRQQQRVWVEQVEQSIRMRLAHMRRFRDVVAMREQALQEEQSAFQKARLHTETELSQLRDRLSEDRTHWNHQRAVDIQRLTKRDQNLDHQFESLQSVRRELDQLREEYQSGLTQFITLTQSESSENDPIEQQEVRQHFHSLLQIVGRQCVELEEAQRLFTRRQQKIREEGNSLSRWISEREEQLEQRESEIQSEVETLGNQEEDWQAARDQWDTDRRQAESVIRELVIQLEMALDEIANLQGELGSKELNDEDSQHRSAA